mgnify:CR=1 FL=1
MPKNRSYNLPSLQSCVTGRVYKLYCRNLLLGVYDGYGGFIGIRTKFGSRYLFTEYHWDFDPHHGTVASAIDLNIDVPKEIKISGTLGAKDERSERLIEWDENLKLTDRPNGWWRFVDDKTTDIDIHAATIRNRDLFDFLDDLEKKGLGE